MNKVRLALYLGILVYLIGCSSFHSEKIDLLAQVPSDCPIVRFYITLIIYSYRYYEITFIFLFKYISLLLV